MTWNTKYKRALVALASIGLVAMLLLVFSQQVLAGNYNRNAAEAYADAWTCNYCEEPHNWPTYRYYDLDCTNYASQVLHEGGYPYRGLNIWSIYHWFHRWYGDSETWYNTPKMNQYFSQYPSEFEYKGWPSQLDKGDIFLSDFPTEEGPPDGIPDHAAVIVGDGGGLKDQHTPPRKRVAWYAYADPGTAYWSVHVKW